MSDLFGNHIVGFPTRRFKCFQRNQWTFGFTVQTPSNEAVFMQRDIEAIANELGATPLFMDATECKLHAKKKKNKRKEIF